MVLFFSKGLAFDPGPHPTLTAVASAQLSHYGVLQDLWPGSEAPVLVEQADNLADSYLARVFRGPLYPEKNKEATSGLDSSANSDTGRAGFQHPHLPCPTGNNSGVLRTP